MMMCTTKDYVTMAIALFLFGVCCQARWTITYLYLMEFLTETHIKCIGPFFNASSGFALLFGAFTLSVLTKDTIVLEYTAASISLLTCLATLFFLPESPKWLVGQG